jgi:ubiquinone/menaquinone biosynthesis C-methylase UbiE
MVFALVLADDASDFKLLVSALDVHASSVIADIGAGPDGLLTIPMARHVGPSGHVYATELGTAVKDLRALVDKTGLENIDVIEGDPARTNLPPNCCDGVFVRFVYHHFADPPAMNASLRQALKPGGKLAIIDFAPNGPEATTPADRAGGKTHGVTAATVTRELEGAGFEPLTTQPQEKRVFLVVVRKPSL